MYWNIAGFSTSCIGSPFSFRGEDCTWHPLGLMARRAFKSLTLFGTWNCPPFKIPFVGLVQEETKGHPPFEGFPGSKRHAIKPACQPQVRWDVLNTGSSHLLRPQLCEAQRSAKKNQKHLCDVGSSFSSRAPKENYLLLRQQVGIGR